MSSAVTFKDVAKLAGVSTQTVSRVTNNAANVNEQTRKRVQDAINQLGYVPNQSAQNLSRRKAKLFGVLTLDLSLQGSARIVESIRHESKKIGYSVSLAVAGDGTEGLLEGIKELKSQQVDAILINAPVTNADALELVQTHPTTPFVFIDVDPEVAVNQVMSNHLMGAQLAAQLLIAQGYQHIGFINGPAHSPAARIRREGWLSVIADSSAQLQAEKNGDWSAESGYSQTMALLAQNKTIDAILVASDQMALGVLRACQENLYEVPQQVAVIGFDDTNNSGYFCPPLTTIAQDFEGIGRQAVAEITSNLKHPTQAPIRVNVAVTLVERQSTQVRTEQPSQPEQAKQLLKQLNRLIG